MNQMPILGLGTWKMENDEELEELVYNAIKLGYRCFDCAYEYGNEKPIGFAIKKAIEENLVSRKELWITTKLWNTFHRSDLVEKQLKISLKNLELDYLDLFVIHWPFSFKPGEDFYPRENGIIEYESTSLEKTWKAMELCVNKGLTNYIGVSNYTSALLIDMFNYCRIKPFCNQIEIHLLFENTELIDFCEERDIRIVAYSPLGGKYDYGVNAGKTLFTDKILLQMSSRYGVSVSQLMLRWHFETHNTELYSVIPKSSSEIRLRENFETTKQNFIISPIDLNILELFDSNERSNDAGRFFWNCPILD